ncbi:MAG: hypothetical protein MUP17_09975 [candidate division Zixibacteria bacterium]|nr:hypothetical protein [candidate division Zixibacteria bacterium]
MITEKANQQFQIVSGMVRKLSDIEEVSLLNFLIGYLWRDEELYKGISSWLSSQNKEEKKGE